MNKMLNYKIIFIFLIILGQKTLAQNSTHADSMKIDTVGSSNLQSHEHLQTLNVLQFNRQKNNLLEKPKFKIPKDSIVTQQLFKLNLLQYPKFNTDYSKKIDDFEFSKKRLHNFLTKKYEEIPNYDLGKFGQYLGIGKKIFAIILGILSLL